MTLCAQPLPKKTAAAQAVVRLAMDKATATRIAASAAGIAFTAPDGATLYLKRAGDDHAGEWCFPGGSIEPGETPEQAAIRECREEIGAMPYGERRVLADLVTDGVKYTTFAQPVARRFTPMLNGDHSAFAWSEKPPEPLHPGVRAALATGIATDEAEFKEADHPRAESGQFGSGGGGATKKEKGTKKDSHESTTVVNGERLTASGGPLPDHVKALNIPPAWKDVTYSADPKADLLATGKDEKGRAQPIYSESHTAKQAAAKFARIQELKSKLAEVSAQNEDSRKSSDPKKSDSADALALIMATGIRPGSDEDTGAAVKAYGATTLEARHVVSTPDGVALKFIGKKGVSLYIPITDPAIAQMMLERSSKVGADGRLFPSTNQGALLEHTHTLDGGGFKSKDFRTLKGTITAADEVAKAPQPNPPRTEVEYRKAVMSVANKVAAVLGNTPKVALQNYIDPSVFQSWRSHV